MTDHTALIEALERAEGPSRELDRAIWYALQDEMTGDPSKSPAFTASIDAALTLVPEGFSWAVGSDGGASVFGPGGHMFKGLAATPAIALVIAALRAKGTQS